jgi:hypothetical protein
VPGQPEGRKHALMYLVDLEAGVHRYAFVEGVGECRERFMRLVEDMERPDIHAVIVAKAQYLFVDTSNMWMEKFIATAKRHHILVADAIGKRQYDLSDPRDEADFRALAPA